MLAPQSAIAVLHFQRNTVQTFKLVPILHMDVILGSEGIYHHEFVGGNEK